MKNANVKGSKVLSLALTALVAIVMVGCGKSSDSNNNNSVNGGYGWSGNCPSCAGMTQPLVTTVGEDRYPESLGLQLYSSTSVNGLPQYGNLVAAQGTFSTANDYTCGVPAGTYQVTTLQPGQYNGSQTVTGLVLQGSGGVGQVTIVITSAYISLGGSGYGQIPNLSTYGQSFQSRFLARGYINYNIPQCQFVMN